MPSGPPEWHEKWCKRGLTDDGCVNATAYLTMRSWSLTRQAMWIKPEPDHVITDEENNAIDYLCAEWDYGGIVDATPCPGCGSQATKAFLRSKGFISCCPDRPGASPLIDITIEPPPAKHRYKGILFRHKKGGLYMRLFEVTHSESLERQTIYVHLWPHSFGGWARPVAMFDDPERFRRLL